MIGTILNLLQSSNKTLHSIKIVIHILIVNPWLYNITHKEVLINQNFN